MSNARLVRVAISDTEWVDLRTRISYGEETDIVDAAVDHVKVDERSGEYATRISTGRFNQATVATWVAGWCVTDDAGTHLPWPANMGLRKRMEIIRGLPSEKADRLIAAVAEHKTALEAEKNAPAGETGGAPSSPSAA